MLSAHRLGAPVTALLLITAASILAGNVEAKVSSGVCRGAAEFAVLSSPIAPWKGAPLRVVVAAEEPLEGELSLIAPDGSVAARSRERHGGPPYFWFAEVAAPAAGTSSRRIQLGCGAASGEHAASASNTDAEPRTSARVVLTVWSEVDR